MVQAIVEKIHELVRERLAAAQRLAESETAGAAGSPASGPSPTGTPQLQAGSSEGEVGVWIDSRGFVTRAWFDDVVADLDPDEVRALTLEALTAAREALRPAARTGADPLARLHDDSVARTYEALAHSRAPDD